MSSDRNAGDQFAMTILIVVVVGLLCAWLAGCATGKPLPPEPQPPSPGRMEALLDAPAARPLRASKPDAVTLVVYPRVVLWGGGVRLRCLVGNAQETRGGVRLALEGSRITTVELPNSIEQSITIERLPCGKSVATCTIARQGYPTIVLTDSVEVIGGICDDGGGL